MPIDQRARNRIYSARSRAKRGVPPKAPQPPRHSLCDVCQGQAHGRKLCDRHRWHHHGHRKRARKYGVVYQYINPHTIYERDHWRCGICNTRVDKTLSYPHRMSASLDHVVPMSSGGDHVPANVQCSHLKCNMDKGCAGSGGEQLALIG